MNLYWLTYLVNMRYLCRRYVMALDNIHEATRLLQRQARKLRATGDPMLERRAQVLEVKAESNKSTTRELSEMLLRCGRELMENAKLIDQGLPQAVLFDVLNVNAMERKTVPPEHGLVEIAFVYGLEDSAMHRGADWKKGPLANAHMRFTYHELLHNQELDQSMHEHLFGKGGMFEFLPTYRQTANGEVDKITVVADRKLELPKPDQPSDFFWLTDEAEPTRQHPRQHSLDLRDAADERGGLRTPIKALAETFTQPDADGVIHLKEAK